MNWHRSPELVDRLAAEYALGTLSGGARRRFESMMQVHPEVAHAAARWDAHFLPLGDALPAGEASHALWSRIENRVLGRASPSPSWWRRLLGPAPAAALALGMVLGVGLPMMQEQLDPQRTELPQSYVGVLATPEGHPGVIVASRRHGRTLDVKVIGAVTVPPGRLAVLWTLDAGGRAEPIGALPSLNAGFTNIPLGRPSEELFARAVELAVSIEAAGPLPSAPTSAYVYRGLCGKLWPAKPTR
jgi:anti-sigma-K factor RskA